MSFSPKLVLTEKDRSKDERLIRDYKRTFLSGGTSSIPRQYQWLTEEWGKSVDIGPDHKISSFGEIRNMNIFEELDDQHYAHLEYLTEYYEKRKKFFSSIGAAIFYLNENFSVFEKGGDVELLAYLKSLGIRIGTSFVKENVGVFVTDLARQTPFKTILRYGEENYLDLFSDFACYARYGYQKDTTFSTINLVFLPKERYTKAIHDSICFALDAEDLTFKTRFMYPTVEQKFGLLETSASYSTDAFLLVNNEGEVVFADKYFQLEFGRPINSTQRVPLPEFMSELSPYLALLRSKARTPVECFLGNKQGKSRFYPVRPQQICDDDGSVIGLKLSITTKQSSGDTSYTRSALFTFDDLVGETLAFQSCKEIAKAAAVSPSNVLIIGESGTGKEMFAQSIHNASNRRKNRFIPINCGAIPKELIGSELFGYEGGSFTGALKEGAPGKFEQANGGTVFLDEIAEMPLDMQSFLLRFLEDGVVSRIGSKKFLNLNVRIIAATNKNLWECVNQNMFRLDLYYRLNVLRLDLPALRDRTDDIELLVKHFLFKLTNRVGKQITSVSPEVIDLFKQYSWRGNVRELGNVLERAANMSIDTQLTLQNIPNDIIKSLSQEHPQIASRPPIKQDMTASSPTPASYEEYETQQIKMLMVKHRGNKSRVAEELNMSRSTLYRRLKSLSKR